MAKRIDLKAKAKKQKIYAAIGGVLLLGVLAFQVPRTMKMLHPPHATDVATTTPAATTPTSGPIAAPSLSGGNATTASATGAGLADSDALPLPQSGQLLTFGRFRTKDPFVQQLKLTCVASSTNETPCPSGSSKTGTGTKPATTTPASGSSGVPTGNAPPAAAAPTTAVIVVNGDSQSVQIGGKFPASDPAFTLISLTATGAKIGIAGGSFENGSQTVTLKKNKPLTLMNTADGARYVLRLVSTS